MNGQRFFGFLLIFGLMAGVTAGLAEPGAARSGHLSSKANNLADGLAIWRKPGRIQGGAACATCHSPDGIELAVYNFDDADLMRRARPHLDEQDSTSIVQYIHALRNQLHFTQLRDPMEDRPLQPGGKILPGETPAARDLAFGYELRSKLPHLFDGRVETVQQAKVAEQEILMLQPTVLQVGIPFNRFSEDIAHGKEHASIAEWLPEAPPLIAAADLSSWYAAEDRYLADPTPDQLHALLLQHSQLVNTSRMWGLGELSVFKFRALLVWQDRIRNRTENERVNVSRDVSTYHTYNPIWEVGEIARELMGRDAHALGMDEETQTKKLGGIALDKQMHELRLGWFWAGWLSDQGMFRTSNDEKTKLGMWLSQSISQDGPYPIHNVFANARRQAVVSNDPEAWGEPVERRRRIWDFAGLRSFEYQLKDMPKEPAYKRLYVDFLANCIRTNLLLLKNDIATTKTVWVKVNTRANAKVLIDFVKSQQPDEAAKADKLYKEILALVDRAVERP
jgi:hypothetical protein